MGRRSMEETSSVGWSWFETDPSEETLDEGDDLARSFVRCFKGSDGAIVLGHLRRTILERRLGPDASDAELRFLEGQRSVAAHILSMVDRGGD